MEKIWCKKLYATHHDTHYAIFTTWDKADEYKRSKGYRTKKYSKYDGCLRHFEREFSGKGYLAYENRKGGIQFDRWYPKQYNTLY